MDGVPAKLIGFGLFLAVWLLVSLVVGVLVLPIWLRGLLGGFPVSFVVILGMRLRGSPARLLVDTALALKHRGIHVTLTEVEQVYLAHKGPPFTPAELADVVLHQRAGHRGNA